MDIQPYVAGKSKIDGRQDVIKLSSNENALGASPLAIQAYSQVANQLFRYPDSGSVALREAIAEIYGLEADRIICGCGSDEILGMICRAYAGAGDEVLQTEHGFLMYAIYAKMVGATVVEAPETNYHTDTQALLDNVTDHTKIVFIANPNNPTGSYISIDALKAFREALPAHILLVLDGAYAEYVEEADYEAGISLVNAYDNVIMTRTFSKIYGLPSLRVGWCYASTEIIDVLNRVRGPFNVTGSAQAAAVAAVKDVDFVTKSRIHNTEQLAYLTREISACGYQVLPSVGNFILVKFHEGEGQAHKIYEVLKEHGIIVRAVANYKLPDCLRITIGTEEENRKLVDILQHIER